MALLFAESFDHYSTAQILRKWSTESGGGTIGSYGRNSTSGYRTAAVADSDGAGLAVPSNPSRLICGFAYKAASLPIAEKVIFNYSESGTGHVNIRLRTDGKFTAYRNTTSLGTSSAGITAAAYNYLELDTSIHDSTGAITMKINGVSVLSLSSQDTRNGGSGVITNISLAGANSTGPPGFSGYGDFDDFYLLDTTGGTNNSFLGDVRVQAIFPTGAGNYTQWTPSAGSNYQCVDENPATDDTDYNSSATANQKDSFAFGDVTPTSGTVYGVQVNVVCRKDDAGSRSLRSLNRLSGTDANATAQTIGSSYANYAFIHETKPGGGSFSITDVNNSEFGYEITA